MLARLQMTRLFQIQYISVSRGPLRQGFTFPRIRAIHPSEPTRKTQNALSSLQILLGHLDHLSKSPFSPISEPTALFIAQGTWRLLQSKSSHYCSNMPPQANLVACKHPGCAKTFKRQYDMERHRREALSHLGHRKTCIVTGCKYKTARKYTLDKHVRDKHQGRRTRYDGCRRK
jgi:hypothetical protein